MSGLSKRERFIIFAALIFLVVFAGVYFFILPLRDNYNFMQIEYELQLERKEEMERKFASESDTRAKLEAAETEYGALLERYPVNMSNTEIERVLTDMFRRNKMHVASFYMSAGVSGENPDAAYNVVTVSSALEGYYNDLLNIIKAVEETGYISVTHVSFGSLTERNQISISLSVMSLSEEKADETV